MDEPDGFIRFIDRLISVNCPFALWKTPAGNIPEIIITPGSELVYQANFKELNGQGFVFAPYQITSDTPLTLLRPGIYRKGIEEIIKIDFGEIQKENPERQDSLPHYFIRKEEYLENIRQTVHEIKTTKLNKAVVSRLVSCKRNNESTGEIYVQLLRHTSNSFVYIVNLPKAGLWMGATPEILLRLEGQTLETVSLAGTQPCKPGRNYVWSAKETEEQAVVSRYLIDVFRKFGISRYTTCGPETLESGQVAHLSTSFRFQARELVSNMGCFIAELHPTPAVCGYPKPEAAQFISRTEKHNRRYYTGFLGPWQLNGNVELFVNLRCMEILPRQYILYSGGGITQNSVPDDEWEETNRKTANLLSTIETVQNK